MNLFTKSILLPGEEKDGIRICIMRRIKPEFSFDMWIPHLAASTELLEKYHTNAISWEEFERLYKTEVIGENLLYFQIVLDILKKNTVTLLCREETPERCHRRLAAEQLLNMDPSISLIHR